MSSTSSVGASNSLYTQGTSRQVERLVSRADSNGDGQLSLSEFNAIGQNQPGSSADSSGSATGSTGTDRSALFAQIDANGDGQLSSSELSSYQKQQIASANTALLNLQSAFGDGSQSGGVHGKHGHHGHHHQASATDGASTGSSSTDASQSTASGDPGLDALFKTLDADGSGSISQSELSTYLTKAIGSYASTGASGGASASAA